jgi:hypothetical protein
LYFTHKGHKGHKEIHRERNLLFVFFVIFVGNSGDGERVIPWKNQRR